MKLLFNLNKPALLFLFFFLFIENAQAQISFDTGINVGVATSVGDMKFMKTADLNGDGISDLVNTVSEDYLRVTFLNNTGGILGVPAVYSLGNAGKQIRNITLADYDGDGNIDIAAMVFQTAGAAQLLYYKNQGNGTFVAPITTSVFGSFSGGGMVLTPIDYDLDDDLDLATIIFDGSFLRLVIFNYNSGFSANTSFIFGGPSAYSDLHSLEVGVFNNLSPTPELIFVMNTDQVYKIGGLTSSITFNSIYTEPVAPYPNTRFTDISINNMDLDGDSDIVLSSGSVVGNNFIRVLDGDGLGVFTAGFTANFGTGSIAADILATDFNNDGYNDIVVATQGDNLIRIYKNILGTLTVQPPISVAGKIFGGLIVADFNIDGKIDLAATEIAGLPDDNYIFLNNTTALLPTPDVCANVSGGNFLASNKVFSPKLNAFTVEGWFKMTDLPASQDQYIFYNGTFGTDGFGLYARAGSKDLFVFGSGSGNFSFSVNASAIKDQWMHFALIKDKSDNWFFYLDGKQTTFTNSNNFLTPTNRAFFGTKNGSGFGNMEGFLQEFRFWHIVLDTKTIREYSHIQANNNHPKYFTLNSYYPLHDNSTVNEVKDVAFMTNKNALYKKATFKVSPNWSADIAPVGDGGSGATINLSTPILNARNTQGFEADFTGAGSPFPNGDIVISRIYDTPTNNLSSAQNFFPTPTGPISRTVFSNIYWVVENYSTNATTFPSFLKEITFDIKNSQFVDSGGLPQSFPISGFPVTAPFPATNPLANAFEIYTRPATSNNAAEWKRVGVCNAFGSVAARKPGSVIDDFGRIQLVIGVDLTILPIHLASFSGKRINYETNLIEWITTFEYKNQLFEIEKSFDAKEFFRIGTEKPTNKTQVQNYSFTDKYATEAAYYRLKQFDEDGKVNYSKTIFISNQKENGIQEFSVYPNPASSSATDEIRLKITGTDNTKPMQMQVFSTMGTKILDISGNLSEIEKILNQNLAKMPLGLYMIQLQTENKIMKTKFIKK